MSSTTTSRRRRAEVITDEAAEAAARRVSAAEVLAQHRPAGPTFMDRLREGACVVKLRTEKVGRYKKLATDEYDVDSSVEKWKRTGATKKLFKHPSFDAVVGIQNEARRFVKAHAVQQSVLDEGKSLVPLRFVPAIYERLQAMRAEFDMAVEDFVANYDDILADERAGLGVLYRARDYPSAEAIREEFVLDWAFEEVSQAAGNLREVLPSLYAAERAKKVQEWDDDVATMRAALRVAFARLVESLVERLTVEPGEVGVKTFKNTLVSNMQDFLALFGAKNELADDDQLRPLVERAQRVLAGIDAQDLRAKEGTREAVLTAMSAINDQLDNFVEVRQRRIVRVAPPAAAVG